MLKQFCDHTNSTWQLVINIFSPPITSITTGPDYAITPKNLDSFQAEMIFRHGLSLFCFNNQVVTSCTGLLIKGPWFTFADTEIDGDACSAFLNKGIKKGVLLLPLRLHAYSNVFATNPKDFWINSARCPWTWGALFTINLSRSRRFDSYSTSSCSCRFNFGYWFVNNFIRIGECFHFQWKRKLFRFWISLL